MKGMHSDFFEGSRPIALVAGGAGLIGSHVCEALLTKQVKVVCIDNWLTAVRENVSHLLQNPNFLLLEQDITKPLPSSISRLNYIVHLAGVEAYLNGEDVSIETLEANSVGARNLCQLAKSTAARFLLVSTPSVEEYFGKGRANEGEFSHSEAKRFAEALVSEYGQKEDLDVRIVRVADVFGPRMVLTTGRPLTNLVKQALYNEKLGVPGGEEVNLYPVFVGDVADGIIKTLLGAGTKGKIISLAGTKTSLFSLAETIKKVVALNPKLAKGLATPEIEFVQEKFVKIDYPSEEILYTGQNLISWKPKASLEEGLVKSLEWFLNHKERLVGRKSPKPKKPSGFWTGGIRVPKPTIKVSKLPIIGLIFLLLLVFSPFLGLLGGMAQLELARRSLVSGNSQRLHFWSGNARFFLNLAQGGFMRLSSVPGLGDDVALFAERTRTLERAARILAQAARVTQDAQLLASQILGDEAFDPQTLAGTMALELDAISQDLAFLEAEMAGQDLSVISKSLDFASLRQALSASSTLLYQAGDLLGTGGQKKYLVLFQNNMELRPTGGFIGSYALATFDKGRLVNLDVQDVYSADGQLRGHVEPPEPIKEHLGEASWYLRDSNWSPDFPTSARRAAWFIEKELGEEVDGVLGIDLEFVKELVAIYGPINLPDFGETIDPDNLYIKTQKAAEQEFFPGSRAKKDFLTALSRALLDKALDPGLRDNRKLGALGRALFKGLQERHVAVWLANQEAGQALALSGWDGGLRKPRCPSEACINDYLMLVEANLGVNKANYFLDRSLSLEVWVEEEVVKHQLTVSYKNRSESGVWPGGEYKNYLRIFLPEGSEINLARLISPGKGDQKELEVDKGSEKGRVEYGMLASVGPGEASQLVVSWDLAHDQDQAEQLLFFWQKQMGTLGDPVWLRFNLPSPALTGGQEAIYNSELSRDLLFNLSWQTQR